MSLKKKLPRTTNPLDYGLPENYTILFKLPRKILVQAIDSIYWGLLSADFVKFKAIPAPKLFEILLGEIHLFTTTAVAYHPETTELELNELIKDIRKIDTYEELMAYLKTPDLPPNPTEK